jgi:hypothetical protein
LYLPARREDFSMNVVPVNGWPLRGASIAAIPAWLNIELAKNAAELGQMRFLFRVTA